MGLVAWSPSTPRSPAAPRLLGRVVTGGQARDVAVEGRYAYVAAGSAGLVIVDVSDLATPTIVGSTRLPGTALRLDYSARTRVRGGVERCARVRRVGSEESSIHRRGADDRRSRRREDDRPAATSRVLGIAARDRDVFVGNWHQIYSYRLFPERLAPNLRLPEAAGMVDFGPIGVGASRTISFPLTNQGTAPLTVFSSQVLGAAFAVTPNALRILPGETARLSLTYRRTSTAREEGYLQILSDDPAAPLRTAFLVGNQPGVGLRMPLPETTGVLLDGSTWSSADAAGKVLLLNFFATFCPVCGGELPDVEARFWRKYRDRGLVVVSLNAHDSSEQVGQVQQYVEHLLLTFPVGLEQSSTYKRLTQNFAGTDPFPVDVIVGKDGRIEYIAREYDPDAMTEVLERLLAQ